MQAARVELRGGFRQQVWKKLSLAVFSLLNMGLAGEVLHGYVDRELLQSVSGRDVLWCTVAGLALLVNCGLLFGLVLLPSRNTAQSRRSVAINRLYREIRSLMESSP